jgi:hypothetical protein
VLFMVDFLKRRLGSVVHGRFLESGLGYVSVVRGQPAVWSSRELIKLCAPGLQIICFFGRNSEYCVSCRSESSRGGQNDTFYLLPFRPGGGGAWGAGTNLSHPDPS